MVLRLTIFAVLFLISALSFGQSGFNEVVVFDSGGNLVAVENKMISIESVEKASKDVLAQLQQKGYINAVVDSSVLNNNRLEVFVNVGRQYEWKSLKYSSGVEAAVLAAGLRKNTVDGTVFTVDNLMSIHRVVVAFYENSGYPFASSFLDSVVIDGNKISAVLSVDKGPFITVDSVFIDGNVKISPYFIYNVINLHPSDPYSEKVMKAIEENIENVEFLRAAGAPQLKFTGDKVTVDLNLKKRNANTFDGIIGFYSDDKTGKIAFNGNFNLKLVNAFGSGEKLHFNWNRPVAGNQTLKLFYSQPYLFRSRFGFSYLFSLYKQDSSFLNLENKPALVYRFSPDDYIHLYFSQLMSQTETSGNDSLYGDFNSLSMGLGFGYSTLDYKFNPRKGFAAKAELEAGRKNIKLGAEANAGQDIYTRAMGTVSFQWYLPLFANSAFLFSNNSSAIFCENISANELFRIGGFKTLRGFDEESLRASAFSIFDFEYRLLFARNSNLAVFYNFAFYERKTETSYFYDIPSGFGAGLNIDTGAGILSLFYAIGKQQGNPLRFNESKIHFGYLVKF
jgi:outer membrane protein assembly factor BamA